MTTPGKIRLVQCPVQTPLCPLVMVTESLPEIIKYLLYSQKRFIIAVTVIGSQILMFIEISQGA